MKKRKDQPIVREQMVTYDDYARMPEDGKRYEVADGRLELLSAPSPKHQIVSSQMQSLIMNACQSEYIIIASPVDLILSAKEVRQPDLVMIHRSRMEIITHRAIEGVPDLVAEILSPHSVKKDRHKKLKVYAEYRIPEYWIVDPANMALEQYQLTGDKYELVNLYDREEVVQSERLPCVAFTVAQIVDAAADLPG